MAKFTKIISFVLLLTVLVSCFGCGSAGQTDTRTSFEKIVDFVKETGKDNSIFIEGDNPTENIRISVQGNILRLERGDGNYMPTDGISNTLKLDLKENKDTYNYEGYWCQNGGYRLYKISGSIEADKFSGDSVPIPYDTYSAHASAPTTLELRILNQQMYVLISTVRNYINNAIKVDLYVEFGFDKLL